ncbi:hypothetical protein [Acinetobacter pittii]|uniref:hypothetical protein n=1 Tax=Acinetobacter pittii TaxID=48296 RepID=UPI00192BDB2D|nr:hypothetical protein [Acinetobacter pittii]
MSDKSNNWKHTYDTIRESAGNKHINRTYKRSFSVNIFQMNTIELLQLSQRINDPNEGLDLMMAENRDAGNQTHREVTRLVHNFVASAKTLVEHTRNFMKEHYQNTSIYNKYIEKIKLDFGNEPVIKFVEDLRNFLLHNGLPPTEMYLEFKSNPNTSNGDGAMKTGIRLKTKELLKWKGWTALAKRYLENSNDFIDIHNFASDYEKKVINFHNWLNNELNSFHSNDLTEYNKLVSELHSTHDLNKGSVINKEESSEKLPESNQEELFDDNTKIILNDKTLEILSKVEELSFPDPLNKNHTSDRIPSAIIKIEELIETPILWTYNKNTPMVFFIKKSNKNYGLMGEPIADIEELIKQLLEFELIKNSLSEDYLKNEILKWIRLRFLGLESTDFVTKLLSSISESIREYTVWVPISNLQVEEVIEFGPARIIPLNKTTFDSLELQVTKISEQAQHQTALLFSDLRKEMQGLSALEFRVNKEREKVSEYTQALAEVIINLLCFLSPAAKSYPSTVNISLLGNEIKPVSKIIIYNSETFSYTSNLLSPSFDWYISENKQKELQTDLSLLETLIYPEKLNQFATTVRSSLLLFSLGSKLSNPIDRLTYCLLSIENLLLKHSAEPIEFTIEKRMKDLIKNDKSINVQQYVREAYRIKKRKSIEILNESELQFLRGFIYISYLAVYIAFRNINQFENLSEFIDQINHP